jgi:uncharacterized repeat protein (TIGR03806 family)
MGVTERLRFAAMAALMAALAAACTPQPEVRLHAADAYPQRLSEWGLIVRNGRSLTLGRGVAAYEVNSPLFTDYALKLRTYYLPDGSPMRYHPDDSFEFPVGSIITKTFFYPVRDGLPEAAKEWDGDVQALDLDAHRLMETRLLVRQADGWDALPYVWDGDDAVLRVVGAVAPLELTLDGQQVEFPYLVPARSECASCHATDHADGRLQLVGLKARQLNRDYPGTPGNQLTRWARAGHLEGLPDAAPIPHMIPWEGDEPASTAERARSYLDSNCGHCHSASGPAKTSGLLLDAATTDHRHLGLCKPPIAAGRGTGGRRYSITPGDPDASILVFRMEASDPAIRMPELGRSLVHREGVALVRGWIESLPGQCVTPAAAPPAGITTGA